MTLKVPRRRGSGTPSPVVTIEGEEARATLPEGPVASLKLEDLLQRMEPGVPDSRDWVLPDGVKCVLPKPNGCIVVHQTPPRVYNFKWIASDSSVEYGPGTSYRQVRVALPYLILVAAFDRMRGGIARLSDHNECFFLNQPLDVEGVETELCYPALLNCSRFPDLPQHPLAWICTQNLRRSSRRGETFEQSLRSGLRALLHHLLETGFNRSSENHELNSWFSETVAAGVDPRVASVEAWEQATAADPLFVLEVPWLRTGHSLRALAQRIAGRRRARATCAEDVARVIFHGEPR